MNIRTEVLAFRIWAYAKPKGWDCSVQELAEFLSESPQRVGTVCSRKGWIGRLRASKSFILDVNFRKDEDFEAAVKEIDFERG